MAEVPPPKGPPTLGACFLVAEEIYSAGLSLAK